MNLIDDLSLLLLISINNKKSLSKIERLFLLLVLILDNKYVGNTLYFYQVLF